MVLSSDELEILDYLKSWQGNFVSLMEICRSAGNRQKFKETPNWANPLMSRLIEANMVEMNERGHYRYVGEPERAAPETAGVVGEDYFPDDSEEESGKSSGGGLRRTSPRFSGRPGRNFKSERPFIYEDQPGEVCPVYAGNGRARALFINRWTGPAADSLHQHRRNGERARISHGDTVAEWKSTWSREKRNLWHEPDEQRRIVHPASGASATTGSLGVARDEHTATLLTNGLVLVAAGNVNGGGFTNSAELYDPVAGAWTPTGPLAIARYGHTATLLADGQVMVAGGVTHFSLAYSAELLKSGHGNLDDKRRADRRPLLSHGDIACERQSARRGRVKHQF